MAADLGDVELVEMLLQAGCDLKAVDKVTACTGLLAGDCVDVAWGTGLTASSHTSGHNIQLDPILMLTLRVVQSKKICGFQILVIKCSKSL